MEKIRAALYVFTQSLTSPNYYRELIKTKLKFSFKYYIVLAFLFTLATTVSTLIPILPKINQGVDDAITYALDLYEEDLIITVEGGDVTINKEEPYIIPFPGNMPEVPKNLIVFDSEGTLEDLERTYDTIILINSKNILIREEDKIEAYPVSTLPEGTLTKDNLIYVAEEIKKFAKFIPYLVGTLLFLAVSFYYLGFRLIYCLFVAFIFWIVGSIRSLELPFSKYYKVALHSITLPLSLELLNNFFRVQYSNLPWFLFLHLIFGIIILLRFDSDGGNNSEAEEGEIPNK